jgi:hypothetical protein
VFVATAVEVANVPMASMAVLSRALRRAFVRVFTNGGILSLSLLKSAVEPSSACLECSLTGAASPVLGYCPATFTRAVC